VEAIPVSIPLTTPFTISQGTTTAFRNIIVRIIMEDGTVGVGECVTSQSFRDESFESITATINQYLGPVLIGQDPFNLELIFNRLDAKITRNFQAKAGIDMALHDLQGKIVNMPVFRLLGGNAIDRIKVDYTLSADSMQTIGVVAKKWIETGYDTLVVKLKGDITKDVERFRRVREAVGWKINLRADANQCYTPSQAIRVIHKLERYEPEFVEQPVKRWDLTGMAKVAHSVDTPISADESNVTIHDALQLIHTGAADILNIKIPKNGGFYLSKKIAAIAEAADVPCVVGGMMTFEVGRQASRHFTICTRQVQQYASEGCGPASQTLTDHITQDVITFEDVRHGGGYITIPETPGLGVQLDKVKLDKYRVSR
jgi:L-alanine-DL-glutamate epimerase-like enolase superfamily enzyme